ncbi:MAG: TRAP transporter small permease [Verrucomicrobia bacterium]|nr:MAG: TRAP transporter small permease [Verrucomicrobiota bacterium]
MKALQTIWAGMIRLLEIVTIALFAVLVLDVLWGVISRYMPGIKPSDWTEELAVYLLVWVSLLASALTFREHGHLGVDYFVSKFDPSARRLAGFVAEISVLVFSVVALLWGGWRLVVDTLSADQLTPVLQWKIGYLYSVVPITGVFFTISAIEHLVALARRGADGEAAAHDA